MNKKRVVVMGLAGSSMMLCIAGCDLAVGRNHAPESLTQTATIFQTTVAAHHLPNSKDLPMPPPPPERRTVQVPKRTYNLTDGFSVIASNLPATPPENSYLDSTTSNAYYRIEVRK